MEPEEILDLLLEDEAYGKDINEGIQKESETTANEVPPLQTNAVSSSEPNDFDSSDEDNFFVQ